VRLGAATDEQERHRKHSSYGPPAASSRRASGPSAARVGGHILTQ
jgi:hypothetical protein